MHSVLHLPSSAHDDHGRPGTSTRVFYSLHAAPSLSSLFPYFEYYPKRNLFSHPATNLHAQRADQVGKAVQSAYNAVEAYFRTLREKRRHAAAMELIGEMSGKYRGKTKPATKIDRCES